MPNGGSDCCATCWFNAKNKGEAGWDHLDDQKSAFCVIRQLAVDNPFYTYCGNHPHRRPEKDPVPIGPVYTGDSFGNREFWKPSPDTEEVRRHLLDLLERMKEQPRTEYPLGIYGDEIVVWQLGEFREKRAVEGLKRIAAFDPGAIAFDPFGHDRKGLVKAACEALAKIQGGGQKD